MDGCVDGTLLKLGAELELGRALGAFDTEGLELTDGPLDGNLDG